MRIPVNFLIAMSLFCLTACGGNTFITKISASNELSEGGVIYAVENLIDGNAVSSWVVRGDKSGIGSTMVICFNKTISLGKIGFINGFGRP